MKRSYFLLATLLCLNSSGIYAAETKYDLGLSYKNIQLFNSTSPATGSVQSNQNWLGADYQYNFNRSYFTGKIDMSGRMQPRKRHIDASMAEAYLTYTGVEGDHYTLGRKRMNWIGGEKFWQLEHMNGQRSFELMDDTQEGVLGLFIDNPSGSFRSQFFISYFYIPGLTPHLDVANDQVITNSGWYRLPPAKANNLGREINLKYNIEKPNSRDVFLQKSLGVRLAYDFNEKINLSAYSLYKPEPRLRINAEVPVENGNTANVQASAAVNHHFITGGELDIKLNRELNLNAGVVYVDPTARLSGDYDSLTAKLNNEEIEYSTTYFKIEPKYDNELYAHFTASYTKPIYQVSVNALKYFTEHDKGSDQIYSETTKWDTAAGLKVNYLLTERLTVGAQIRYDFVRKDNLLKVDTHYKPWRSLIVGISLETLKAPLAESYWSYYRAQDTLTTYLRYNF